LSQNQKGLDSRVKDLEKLFDDRAKLTAERPELAQSYDDFLIAHRKFEELRKQFEGEPRPLSALTFRVS